MNKSRSFLANDPDLFKERGVDTLTAFDLTGANNRYSLYIDATGVCTKEHLSGITITLGIDFKKAPSVDAKGYLSSASIYAPRRQSLDPNGTDVLQTVFTDFGLTQAWKDGPGQFTAGIEITFPTKGMTTDEQKAYMQSWLKSITITMPYKAHKSG